MVAGTVRPETRRRLRQLGYANYALYTRSPVWKAVRDRYYATHPKACWICGDASNVHLHHCCYDRLGGNETDDDLLPLCNRHHRGLHNYMKRKRVKLEEAHTKYRAWLLERPSSIRKPKSRSQRASRSRRT